MTYIATLEIQTKKALTEDQQDKLREAILDALDNTRLPYNPDVVTASVGEA